MMQILQGFDQTARREVVDFRINVQQVQLISVLVVDVNKLQMRVKNQPTTL